MLHGRYIALSIALGGALTSQPMRAESMQVTISNLQYSPAEIKAKMGDTVVWVNKDFVAPTVLGDMNIEPDKSARLVKKPGAFDYYCRFHPNMTGEDHRAAKVKVASAFSLPQPAIDAEEVR